MRSYMNFDGVVISFNNNREYLNFSGTLTGEQLIITPSQGRINSLAKAGGLASSGGLAGNGGGLAG